MAEEIASKRLLNRITDVMKVLTEASKGMDNSRAAERMGQRLFSADGKVPKPKVDEGSEDRVLATALQTLSALEAARDFSTQCSNIIRMRSVSLVVRADWCRSLAWHYGYILRERSRSMLDALKDHFEASGQNWSEIVAHIDDFARDFKKRTDPTFTDRGRHVHIEEVEDPLVAQVHILGMLAKGEEMQVFVDLHKRQSRKVPAHVQAQVSAALNEVASEVELLLDKTEPLWNAVFDTIAPRKVAA